MKSQMKMLLLILLSTIISSEAVAAIYKWLERNGGIVYSQSRPPAGVRPLKTPKISGSPDSTAAIKAAEEIISSEKDARERRQARQQQKKNDRVTTSREKQLQQNCQKIRGNLDIMKSNARVYIKEADGNNRFLNEEELSQKRREAEEKIKQQCTK